MTANRLLISFTTASFMTFALFLLMQYLIRTGEVELARNVFIPPELLPIQQDTPVDHSVEPVKPPPPVAPPPPRTQLPDDVDNTTVKIATTTKRIDPPPLQLNTAVMDGDASPIFRVNPPYPMAAVTRNLEGHVIVEFTVTRLGTVTDIVVVESTHSVFNKPAIQAVSKYRYRPRIVGGEPVDVTGVQLKLTFELEGE